MGGYPRLDGTYLIRASSRGQPSDSERRRSALGVTLLAHQKAQTPKQKQTHPRRPQKQKHIHHFMQKGRPRWTAKARFKKMDWWPENSGADMSEIKREKELLPLSQHLFTICSANASVWHNYCAAKLLPRAKALSQSTGNCVSRCLYFASPEKHSTLYLL